MKNARNSGFTLLELLVVMGLLAILLGLSTISLVKVQRNASVGATVDTLIADMRNQQTKAMSGSAGGGNYGISFNSSNSYILFHGSSPGGPDDFAVTLDDPISVSTSFPGNVIVFTKASGEVASENTITINNTAGTETKILTVNKLGVVKSAI